METDLSDPNMDVKKLLNKFKRCIETNPLWSKPQKEIFTFGDLGTFLYNNYWDDDFNINMVKDNMRLILIVWERLGYIRKESKQESFYSFVQPTERKTCPSP